jgi:hypothetical protein
VTDDGITPLVRKQDWALSAQLVRVLPHGADLRVLTPVMPDQSFTLHSIVRLTWDDKRKPGSGWTEAEFWAALSNVSKQRALQLSKDNMLQLDDVRLRLANADGRLVMKQVGGLFENV